MEPAAGFGRLPKIRNSPIFPVWEAVPEPIRRKVPFRNIPRSGWGRYHFCVRNMNCHTEEIKFV